MLSLLPQLQTNPVVHEFHLFQNAGCIFHNEPKENNMILKEKDANHHVSISGLLLTLLTPQHVLDSWENPKGTIYYEKTLQFKSIKTRV
jgi:hypothetical protein